MMLRKIRIVLAAVFFIGITLLFLDITGILHHWLGWMAKVQFLPAVLALNAVVIVALVLLTLVFGRIYCSVVCPLGVMQDIVAWFGKRGKKHPYSYSKAVSWLRYGMLGVMIVALVTGVGAVFSLLAPYSSYGRIATHIFQPIYRLGNNVLASIAESVDSYAFYSTDVWVKSLPILVIAVVTFAVLFVLAWRNGRTYCNTICPVGTVLGFLAKFSYFRINFDEKKCRNCGACSKGCKASCIDFKTHSVDYSRCVACGDCLTECKFDALKYSHARLRKTPHAAEEEIAKQSIDTSKRSFLLATVMMTTAALAQKKKKVDGGLAKIEDKVAPERQTPITPPGSMGADHFFQHCTGCQLCVSECPNDVLRPSDGLMTMMQPVMSYEHGYCRPECHSCSTVCPTGAIRLISRVEKSSIQLGHAVWIKKNCVPVVDGVECGNCARHCPTGAIEMVALDENDEESPMVPAVNEARCIGCGACENLCPARPFSAIYVEGHEKHRSI